MRNTLLAEGFSEGVEGGAPQGEGPGGGGGIAGAEKKGGRPSSARRTRKADECRPAADGDRADRRGECLWRQVGERLPPLPGKMTPLHPDHCHQGA